MKDVLACLFSKLICIKDGRQLMAAFSLELKLDTKEGIANEETHLNIFIKFIKKKLKKRKQ